MIPLTVRSHYSLMWGTSSIQDICRNARRLGYTRLALTDTDNLYGLWPFLKACRQEGLVPITGAEITDPACSHRAVCLVKNKNGYRNLCRLITRRHMDENFELKKSILPLADGLIILTGNADLLAPWHGAGLHVAAAIPRRPLSVHHPIYRTAKALGIPVVATPGSFFSAPADIHTHRLLRAIERNTVLSQLQPGDYAPPDAWLAAPEEYARRFAVCPDAVSATRRMAEQITFTGPDFGLVLPPWNGPGNRKASWCLRDAAYAGAQKRYGMDLSEPVVQRMEHELSVICQMGFDTYFLTVRDIVKHSPRTCGRGSGAASLIAYCLGITNVCPVRHNLYFERFLNPGRKDPPDIDVDFAWDERDAVLHRVLETHQGHAAMVASHVLFQERMAIRETAKVFGLPEGEITGVIKRLPSCHRLWGLPAHGLTQVPKRPDARLVNLPRPWPRILALARQLVGSPRYLSVHPGGMVITPNPIDTYVPVQQTPKGVPVMQWEKESAEAAGLVKIDLLGNRSLGVIRDAVANVQANKIRFDETTWQPEADHATQKALAQGRTMGCFYIESPAMRLLQQKSGVGDFEHLVIHSSIIRPAANEFIREYVRRLHGGPWDPVHPLLADILDETFGIMVFQEDVSRVAVAIAGFSHADADGLRKIISKKDQQRRLCDMRDRFFDGARSKGLPDAKISEIWNMMMSFDGYSFCKPHSASYARVSFQAAWLKVHYPAEFMAAVISNQGGFYSTFAYVSEARRMGIEILGPDIHTSDVHWTGRDKTLRTGLMAVKGLSTQSMVRIVAEGHRIRFGNFSNFLERAHPDQAEARALIHCGALDAFAIDNSRAGLLWHLARRTPAPSPGAVQRPLFGKTATISPPRLPPDNRLDRLRREFTVLGFLCTCHPMEIYAAALHNLNTVKAALLPTLVGQRVRLAAWLITGKKVRTKNGDAMEFLTFEDETGIVETTFFPNAYQRFCHMLDLDRPYILTGLVEQDWGAVTLTVDRVAVMPDGATGNG
jgi:DNA polymerase-3 subunit alpha/error-prone DNA polymerase